MPVRHVLNPSLETIHWGYFDARIPARLQVDSGDTVVVDTVSGWGDVMDVSLFRPDHLEIVTRMKPVLGPHILTGPIAVRGAMPGDVLEVRVQAIERGVPHGAGDLPQRHVPTGAAQRHAARDAARDHTDALHQPRPRP